MKVEKTECLFIPAWLPVAADTSAADSCPVSVATLGAHRFLLPLHPLCHFSGPLEEVITSCLGFPIWWFLAFLVYGLNFICYLMPRAGDISTCSSYFSIWLRESACDLIWLASLKASRFTSVPRLKLWDIQRNSCLLICRFLTWICLFIFYLCRIDDIGIVATR